MPFFRCLFQNSGRRVVLLTSLLLMAGCASLPGSMKPEVLEVRPEIQGLDFQGINLVFNLKTNNPYPFAIRSPLTDYGLTVQGHSLFQQSTPVQVTLPARSVETVALPMRVTYSDLLGLVQALKGANTFDYQFAGAMHWPLQGREIQLPFMREGTLPILKMPSFSGVKVEPGETSMFGSSFTLNALMNNPNVFPIDIDELGYVLNFGGVEVGKLAASTAKRLAAGQSGPLQLDGRMTALAALQALTSGKLENVAIRPTGFIKTPYGKVRLGDEAR